MVHWTDFGLNHMPPFSARRRNEFPPPLQALIDERAAGVTEPLAGVTTDGTIRKGLFTLEITGVSPVPLRRPQRPFSGRSTRIGAGGRCFPSMPRSGAPG